MNKTTIERLLDMLLGSDANPTNATEPERYVLVRCTGAGVHAGILVSQEGQVVRLRNSRRLWEWCVPMGAPSFLSGVATHGIDPDHSKVGTPVDIILTEACEIIDCSAAAQRSISDAPETGRTK